MCSCPPHVDQFDITATFLEEGIVTLEVAVQNVALVELVKRQHEVQEDPPHVIAWNIGHPAPEIPNLSSRSIHSLQHYVANVRVVLNRKNVLHPELLNMCSIAASEVIELTNPRFIATSSPEDLCVASRTHPCAPEPTRRRILY
mmetsp:Transcript_19878/g.55301  ORF Transcript_19878/g.55301 Transcript_19878/m.55301 type:complete len:144 (-) Transcript_19878:168-599(-)